MAQAEDPKLLRERQAGGRRLCFGKLSRRVTYRPGDTEVGDADGFDVGRLFDW